MHDRTATLTVLAALARDKTNLKQDRDAKVNLIMSKYETEREKFGNALVLADTKYLCGKERDVVMTEYAEPMKKLEGLVVGLEERYERVCGEMMELMGELTEAEKDEWLKWRV